MGKRTYHSVSVKGVNVERVAKESGGKVVVAIDVAKVGQFASFGRGDGEPLVVGRWSHPGETAAFFSVCEGLQAQGVSVEAVMEPTGTYGDPIRSGLLARGIMVFRVSGKRVKDASEVWDGVPSQHDVKSTHIISRLHAQNLSAPWPLRDEAQREMAVARHRMDEWTSSWIRNVSRLEALLGRVWPELGQHLSLTSASALQLLAEFGGPREVSQAGPAAGLVLRRVGRSFLSQKSIDGVLASAEVSLGVPMISAEVTRLRELASEAQRSQRKRREAEKQVLALAGEQVPQAALDMVGPAAATAFIAHNVSPSSCDSAGAFIKALGLNLRVKSSGKQAGKLHITKRGPGIPRQLTYLATLRVLKTDPIARAWYDSKRQRDGGGKNAPKAIIALQRKLLRALWHVWTRGEAFDATRLFDVSRLQPKAAA